ncbi:MAG: aminoglycoside phosphotransferase family protein [Caldilineaceae bacterium]
MLKAIKQDAQIAQGATADLFAWPKAGESVEMVLKLYYAGYPLQAAQHEAANAQIAHAAGLPTPSVAGIRQVGERAGVLFERVQGPTMLEQILSGASEPAALARLLAELHVTLHQTRSVHAEAPQQQTRLRQALNRAALNADERAHMQQMLHQLIHGGPTAGVLCHGDFHPSNIILSPAGPMIIDWVDLTQGDPVADVARTLLLLEHSALPPNMTPEMVVQITALRREFAAAYLARYAELQPLDNERLQSWLRVAAAARLAENISAAEAALLRQLMVDRAT